MKRLIMLLGLLGASPAAAQPVQPHPFEQLGGRTPAAPSGERVVDTAGTTRAVEAVCDPDLPLIDRSLACFARGSASPAGSWPTSVEAGMRLDGVRRRPESASASATEAASPTAGPRSDSPLAGYTGSSAA
jgi:hypothetical protein